jgi:hypothetical protein
MLAPSPIPPYPQVPKIRTTEPKSVLSPDSNAVPINTVPLMRRLLSTGVSAGRHVIWYLTYHTASGRQRQSI